MAKMHRMIEKLADAGAAVAVISSYPPEILTLQPVFPESCAANCRYFA